MVLVRYGNRKLGVIVDDVAVVLLHDHSHISLIYWIKRDVLKIYLYSIGFDATVRDDETINNFLDMVEDILMNGEIIEKEVLVK